MGLFDKIKNKLDSGNDGGSPAGNYAFPPAQAPPPLEASLARYRRQRGINLGSWFVTESWLSTKLYASTAVDPKGSDFDLARGKDAKAAMEHHWDTWMTDDDWHWIKQRGFNSVRLPIGYYHLAGVLPDVLRGTDYERYADVYTGAWPRILGAIDKAAQFGLGVLVDFHAAAGAQNTDGHSGMSEGKVRFWDSNKNLASTSLALRFLASQLSPNPAVIGLEILNEPANNQRLQGWYESTLNEVRQVAEPEFPIYVSDSWATDHYAPWVGHRNDFVVLDHHLYRCFDGPDKQLNGYQHAGKLQHEFASTFLGQVGQARGNVVVGEWSAGLDESCLPHDTPAGERDAQKRAFVASQLQLFENTGGYFFWTLKTDRDWDSGWSARNCGQAEILPATVVLKKFNPPPDGARDTMCRQATDSHCNYWHQNNGNPNGHAFSSGFSRGWDDALLFLTSEGQNELGFVDQWARRRKWEYEHYSGPLGNEGWQYTDAFNQGVKACHSQALS